MDEFLCWFADEDEEDGKKVRSFTYQGAAKYFAAWVNSARDMWEVGDEWGDDFTIAVKHLYTGTIKRFNITREYEPVFSATEVRE